DLLSALGAETALGPDQRLDREMMLIYECATLPAQRLYLSYAALDLDGTERRPAFLIPRVRALFPAGLGTLTRHTVPAALRPALDDAAVRGDLAALAALSALPGGELGIRCAYAREETRENLTPEAVRALYRGTLHLSASRMDKVKSCHYAYFLQYGLKAKQRKPATLDAPESGTFVHFVLETVLRAAREAGGVGALEDDAIEMLCKQATETYLREQLGGLEDKSPRFAYLFRRLAASAVQVVRHMVEELRASDFEPVAFELGFGQGEDCALPPVQLDVDGIRVSISGFVDRVDGWVHDGRLYLRVMDYKTGRKTFDFTDVWHGLNLQMLLYLFTLEEQGLPGQGREIVPAGVLYLPAMEGRISGSRSMEEDAARAALDKKLRRSGLLLSEQEVLEAMEHLEIGESPRFLPVRVTKSGAITGECLASAEQLGRLRRHIQRVLRDIARELGGGNIAADPCYHSEQDVHCRYCEFASACHFSDGVRGERRRYLYPVSGKQFWQRIEEQTKGGK
ncbi:MAG: PD-(D/E)XK nuclease family protein, partial [Oscillospiraceae bacterium]|nr:PD-(D/E)XK nuclease family protein [Oscillospiraceae bacterium]